MFKNFPEGVPPDPTKFLEVRLGGPPHGICVDDHRPIG